MKNKTIIILIVVVLIVGGVLVFTRRRNSAGALGGLLGGFDLSSLGFGMNTSGYQEPGKEPQYPAGETGKAYLKARGFASAAINAIDERQARVLRDFYTNYKDVNRPIPANSPMLKELQAIYKKAPALVQIPANLLPLGGLQLGFIL